MGVARGRIDVVFESERLISVFVFVCCSQHVRAILPQARFCGSCATPWPGDEFPAQLRAELALG